jgi:predicted nucleic acid-binding protein
VKLVVQEAESDALGRFLAGGSTRTSCALVRVEVPRAVAPRGAAAVQRARGVVATLDLVRLDDALLDAAGDLQVALRSLDAIHVAAACELGDDLECLVTYDRRMAAVAETLGLAVRSPA